LSLFYNPEGADYEQSKPLTKESQRLTE